MNLLQQIFSITNEKYHKVITILGLRIKLKDKIKKELFELEKRLSLKINNLQNRVDLQIKRTTPRARLKSFEVHIVEHCNLKCKGCGHFAPLAQEEFLDIEVFKKDLNRIAELTNKDVEFIQILGGEPLLHPSCIDFCVEARKIFNAETQIRLVTNGILLDKQSDEFYQKLAEYNILISPTKYPINIDWESIKKKCEKFNTSIEFYQGTGETLKRMRKETLDLEGKQDEKENIINCRLGEPDYHYLEHGKLFPCWKPVYIRHFNKYFNKKLEVTDRDYIDIYKAKNLDEILQFMAKPIPFCKYCDLKNYKEYDWKPSKKEITEWV